MLTAKEKERIEALINLEMPEGLFEEMLQDEKVKALARIIAAESVRLKDVSNEGGNYRELYVYFSKKYTDRTKGLKMYLAKLRERFQSIERLLDLVALRRLTMYRLLRKAELT